MFIYMQPIQSGDERLTNKNHMIEMTSFTFFMVVLSFLRGDDSSSLFVLAVSLYHKSESVEIVIMEGI